MNTYGMNINGVNTNVNGTLHGHSAPPVPGHGMKISRFFGSTNREVMRQVRMALGSEALIVSNRRVNGGVEILATDATPIAVDAPVVTAQPPVTPVTAQPVAQPTDVMHAITALRGELEHRMDDLVWNQQIKQAPQVLSLFQTLLGLGFSTALLRAMLKRLPPQLSDKAARAWVRAELMAHLPVCADQDALWRPGLALALVGPTGVGKTTTLAKLAARAVRRFGPQQVVLVTTDTYRIGACEQLKIYGQILRVPVHVAHDAQALRRIVQGLAQDQVMLIDNVGVSQRDHAVHAQAAMLREAGRDVVRLLVLNAASHGDTLDEVARNYRNDGGSPLAGCIISKRDEALRLAPALDTAIRHQLRIHFVSDGQKVPEHLSCASAQDLIDQALAATPSGHTLYTPNRADLAALMSLADDASKQDGQRLLAGFLALSHPAGQTLSPALVTQACREIDAQSICAQAFKYWRNHHQAAPAPFDPAEQVHALRTAVRSAHASVTAPTFVVGHDHAAIAAAQSGQGRLYWAQLACLSGAGDYRVVSSPLQSWQLANAWSASCGTSALGTLDLTQTQLRQVQWFQQAVQDVPLLHVFDGGSRGLWRALQRLETAWMALCAPGTAVVHADTVTHAGALARHATYQMLDTRVWQHSLPICADRPLAHVAIWFAVDDVALRQRGQADMSLRLIHVRLQDQRDGRLIRQCSALSHTTLDDAALVQLVVTRLEQKWVARAVQAFWRRLTQASADTQSNTAHPATTPQYATLAIHLGLAAWQIQHSDPSCAAQQVLQFLCTSPKPSVNAIASGLLRVFALKEMLPIQERSAMP